VAGVGPGYCCSQRCTDLGYCLSRVRNSGEKGSTILNSGCKFIVAELVGVIGLHEPKNRIKQIDVYVVHGQVPFLWR
jgi:hypothetical protein